MSLTKPVLHTLSNGIQIVAESMPGTRSMVIALRFKFGTKDDPKDQQGLAYIAENTLFKGTPHQDAREIFDSFDALGIRRSSSTAIEYTEFQAQILPRHFRKTVNLYSEIFRNASFPDDQVQVSKTITLEELKRLEDSPIQKVLYLTYQAGLGSPMGRIPMGNPDTVSAITPQAIRNYWSTFCKPQNLIISAAGELNFDEIFKTCEEIFGEWSSGSNAPQTPHYISVASLTTHHHKASEQEHIGLLFGSVPRGHDLYYPAQIAIAILSGSGSSRLFTEVREKRGLAYSVAAFYSARRGGGFVSLYAGTTPDRADETLKVCLQEITRLAIDSTTEELERAKTILKGRLYTTGDLPEGRSGSLIGDLFLEGKSRSIDEISQGINSVSLNEISEYLEAFPPKPLTLVTLGPRSLQNF